MPKETKQQLLQDIQQAIDYIKLSDFTFAINLALKYFNKTRYLDLFLEKISNAIKEFLDQNPKFDKIIDNNIKILLPLAKENEKYDLFIARFYELKGDDENAIRLYQKTINAPIEHAALTGIDIRDPAPSIVAHLYLGRLFYRTKEFEKAIENYHKARKFVDNVLICNSSRKLNEELTKYYSDKIAKDKNSYTEDPYSEPFETVEDHYTKKIAPIEDLRNSYKQHSEDYKKIDKFKKAAKDDEQFKHLTKDLANMYWERALVYHHQPQKFAEYLNDMLSAINLFPHPKYYSFLARSYYNLHKLSKAAQYYIKSCSIDSELIAQYPEEESEITQQVKKNQTDLPKSIEDLMQLGENCNQTKTLPEYINLWNKGISAINEKLPMEKKVPKITLLEEVQTAKNEKKSIVEIIKIYNAHINEIRKEHEKFSNLEELSYPASLFTLAGLVVVQSGIFNSKAKAKLSTTAAEATENNPLIQIITFNPS